jgi:hypothetical protein
LRLSAFRFLFKCDALFPIVMTSGLPLPDLSDEGRTGSELLERHFAKLGRKDASRERECAAVNLTEQAAVASATVKAGLRRKPKLAPAEFARRLALEKLSQRARYCDALALWRTCRRSACRRHRRCGGDADICLRQALARVPHQLQWRARQDILAASPANLGAPERQARQCMPRDLYE